MLSQEEPFIPCTGKKGIASKARSSPLEGSSFRNKTSKQKTEQKSKLDWDWTSLNATKGCWLLENNHLGKCFPRTHMQWRPQSCDKGHTTSPSASKTWQHCPYGAGSTDMNYQEVWGHRGLLQTSSRPLKPSKVWHVGFLVRGPQRPVSDALKVKPVLPWRPQNVGCVRTIMFTRENCRHSVELA